MILPLMQTMDHDLSLMQTKWRSILNPVLSIPIIDGRLIQNVSLVSGDNTINHGLGKKLQGYIVVLNNSPVTFYDKQSENQMANLTLILNASGTATVTLWVF